MEQEMKWKANAHLHELVAAWAEKQGAAETTIEMDAQYYDTADGFLASRGAGLRIRLENGNPICCLKCRGSVSGAEHVREEYECAANSISAGIPALLAAGAPAALCRALQTLLLQETCRVCFTRRAFAMHRGEMTAELALDCGNLQHCGRNATFFEIELEHKHGPQTEFSHLAKEISKQFALIPEPNTKLSRAYAL